MRLTFEKSVSCPMLIGRSAYLEALQRLAAEVQAGRGTTALISGEAGIGKTRLAHEAGQALQQQGWLVLKGRCSEIDRVLPYAPLVDLLQTRFAGRGAEAMTAELGSGAPLLAPLLPELAAVASAPVAELPPEQEQRRLFHTLLELLTRLAFKQPVLLIIEDLHWSDASSLQFLLYLAQRVEQRRLLLLLTYRPDEVPGDLRYMLAELDRQRLARELQLQPLSVVEVNQFLGAIFELDQPVRVDFLATLYELTEGNPFFIEEVLKSLVAAGEIFYTEQGWDRRPLRELHIPRSIQDAVQRRQQQLSPAAQELLLLAAVVGPRVEFALLQQLSGQPEHTLLGLLKQLILAQLLVEEPGGWFAFRHALTRQAVSAGLLALERKRLHRSIAEALEQLYGARPQPHLAELAYHFDEAGCWEQVLPYALQAAERAQALYAPHAVIEHLERALAALEQLGRQPQAQLYLLRGVAHYNIGAVDLALADLDQALQLSRAAGDRRAEWQALIELGMLWQGRDYERAGDYYQPALELARQLGEPAMLGRSLNRIGNALYNTGDGARALHYHEEALAIFQTLDDRHGLAETLDLLGLTSFDLGRLPQGTVYQKQAAQLYRELDERHGLVNCLGHLVLPTIYETEITTGINFPDLLAYGEEAVAVARSSGSRAVEAFALFLLGVPLSVAGSYARALPLLREALALADAVEHQPWCCGINWLLGWLHDQLLDLQTAHSYAQRAAELAESSGMWNFRIYSAALLARLHVQEGQPALARAVADTMLGLIDQRLVGRRGPDPARPYSVPERRLWVACAEVALAEGDAQLALDISEQLIRCATNMGSGQVIPELWLLRARALCALGREQEAAQLLEEAQTLAREQGRLPRLWQILLLLGDCYRAQRLRQQAEQCYAEGRALLEQLAADVAEPALREQFLLRALALFPASQAPAASRSGRALDLLTARECQVAALVALGKSNRAIADELVLSERTVEKHVANILSKLNYRSRAQIAVWAQERGLASAGTV